MSDIPFPSAAIDQCADVFSTPDRGLATEFDAFGELTLADASPPRRAADGDDGEDLGESNEAGFRQDRASQFHGEHPWSFWDALN